jgi:alpha-amylase/alpha-mannosidase (GH57 family)
MYKDPLTAEYRLPWVRLHGVNAYYTMARLAEETPELALTFNLVPSLLLQIEDYAAGVASDPWLEVARAPADSLTEEQRAFLLYAFFLANPHTMIAPFPRYRELFTLRGPEVSQQECLTVSRKWTTQQCRDLQVWFHLAWSSPLLRREDPILFELERKGMRFTEEEKAALFSVHRRVLGDISIRYRGLEERGAVELSTSPFYHPILPLLVDNWIAKVSNPYVKLPAQRFMWPEDARSQIQRGLEFHSRIFGRFPRGLWPSEGSVSEAVVKLAAETGIVWMATDEEIFHRSLSLNDRPASPPYQPASIASAPNVALFFRDHDLSDRIGFRYSHMDADVAVEDLFGALHRRWEQMVGNHQPSVVTIALDGENPWETYPDQGIKFLRSLYRRLLQEPWLRPVTPSSFLHHHPVTVMLEQLHPGSWIGGNFNIWIGHEEDNRAWELLTQARQALEHALQKSPRDPAENLQTAVEALYAAEGSDWTWWYGEDHFSGFDEVFDELFRSHIQAVYSGLGLEVPSEVSIPIKRPKENFLVHQSREISPIIDGQISHYFEWLGAGSYTAMIGTMRSHARWLKTLAFGFSREGLFLRMDPDPGRRLDPRGRLEVQLEGMSKPLSIPLDQTVIELGWGRTKARAAIGTCIELFIPHDETSGTIQVAVTLWQENCPVDRLPATGFLALEGYQGIDHSAGAW